MMMFSSNIYEYNHLTTKVRGRIKVHVKVSQMNAMSGASLAKLVGQGKNVLADGFHMKIGRFNVDKP